LQGEIGDTDSSKVCEILGIITKLKFDCVANTTAVQFHLKKSDVPWNVKRSDEVTHYEDTKKMNWPMKIIKRSQPVKQRSKRAHLTACVF